MLHLIAVAFNVSEDSRAYRLMLLILAPSTALRTGLSHEGRGSLRLNVRSPFDFAAYAATLRTNGVVILLFGVFI